MKTVTVEEIHAQYKAQGVERREDIAVKCPICSTIQSAQSLISAGAGTTMDEVEKYLGFSCVGRFTNAGPHKRNAEPGKGCDWTLGGFFKLHGLEVITPDGQHHPTFEPASPDEARELVRQYNAGEAK